MVDWIIWNLEVMHFKRFLFSTFLLLNCFSFNFKLVRNLLCKLQCSLKYFLSKAEAGYEIVFDRIESAWGDDDKFVKFETLRVKKYNRTM